MSSPSWIGLPYSKYSCWDLCVLVFNDALGISLPTYPRVEESNEPLRHYIDLEVGAGGWIETALHEVKKYDILELRALPTEPHVGVSMGDKLVLTTMRGLNSMLVTWIPNGQRRAGHHELRAVRAWRHPKC